jgi:hypothetical protein
MKQTSSSQNVHCQSKEFNEGFSGDPGTLSLMKSFNFTEFLIRIVTSLREIGSCFNSVVQETPQQKTWGNTAISRPI